MALIQVMLEQLEETLSGVIQRAQNDRPTTAALFELMYNTGLRIREVIEVERWQPEDNDTYTVQLEKGEGTRIIQVAEVPALIEQQYASGLPFTMETYSAVNNTFKYYAPGILFGSDTRRTTLHAFRYRFMKRLEKNGATIPEIAAIMGHINQANTARYVTDIIWMDI